MAYCVSNTVLGFSSDISVLLGCCLAPLMLITALLLIFEVFRKQRQKETSLKIETEENKKIALLQEKASKFIISSEYRFIEQFTKKYSNKVDLILIEGWTLVDDLSIKGSNQEFLKLQMLLKNKQWEFSIKELKILTALEAQKQRAKNAKSKILVNNPLSRREIIESYLNHFQSNDSEMLLVLEEILQERELFSGWNELKTELSNLEKEFELRAFEKRLFENDEQIQLKQIDVFTGYEFESFLKNLFSKMGYQVEQTRLSGDQGADLVVVKFGEKTVIQAKHFGGKVGNKAVQEILAAMSLYQAHKGMVITNNYFTPAAVELANANNIELVDRDALEELINKHW